LPYIYPSDCLYPLAPKPYGALIIFSADGIYQTEKRMTEKWRPLFFCPVFFSLALERMIKAFQEIGKCKT
jgi:hypothetical protein